MKRASQSSVCLAAIFFAASLALGQPLTIQLKNGDRISGTLVSESTNQIVLSNAWAARLIIPLAEVTNRTGLTNATAIAMTSTNKVTNAVAFAKVVASTNTLFNSPHLKNWHGEMQVGMDLTFGERNREVYNGRAKLAYAKDRFKSVIDYDATYGRSHVEDTIVTPSGVTYNRTRSVTDANRMFGSHKAEYDFTKRWFLYNLGGAGYDEIRKIDLRYEVGPGLGYRLITITNLQVTTEGGFNYQEEQHTDGGDVHTFFARLGETAAWKITPRLTWDERFEYTPRLEDPADYRMRFETNVRYALLQNIFLNLSLVDIYDSQPAEGVDRNDLQIRSSVGVKF